MCQEGFGIMAINSEWLLPMPSGNEVIVSESLQPFTPPVLRRFRDDPLLLLLLPFRWLNSPGSGALIG